MAKLQSLCFFLLGAHSARVKKSVDCYSKYDGLTLLKLSPCDADAVKQMRAAIKAGSCQDLADEGLEIPRNGECAEALTICPHLAAHNFTSQFGDKVFVEAKDAGTYFRKTSGLTEAFGNRGLEAANSFYSSWRDLADQEARVDAAVAASNGVANIEILGYSHEKRPMRMVRITGRGYQAGDPKVVLTFNIHAREWVSGMAGVYAVENIIEKAKKNPTWLAGMEVAIIPMVNPDGFHFSTVEDRMWRKNRNGNSGNRCKGVDLNRNFPIDYGGRHSTSTWKCSDTYIGRGALSEPESKAVAKAIDETSLTVLLDVHCYGRVILRPWSYTNRDHPRREEVDDLGWKMLKEVKSSRNNAFQYGGNELLGEASGVLPDYANDGLGYTYELTTSFTPATSEILPSAIETLDGIYAAIKWSKAKR